VYVDIIAIYPRAIMKSPFVEQEKAPIDFDGSLSYDLDGLIISWHWDFGDGTISTDKIPIHKYTNAGTYIVILIVTDNDDLTNQTTNILIINKPPIADFRYFPSNPKNNEEIQFIDMSTDEDGYIFCQFWDLCS